MLVLDFFPLFIGTGARAFRYYSSGNDEIMDTLSLSLGLKNKNRIRAQKTAVAMSFGGNHPSFSKARSFVTVPTVVSNPLYIYI